MGTSSDAGMIEDLRRELGPFQSLDQFESSKYADQVLESVALTKIEREIIQTPEFQRLKYIRQLGISYLLYPKAKFYSRYNHSIGVCHLAGRIMEALWVEDRKNGSRRLTPQDVQYIRLAALLHDVGHYPFSHTMEYVLKSIESQQAGQLETLGHERVGSLIVRNSPGVSNILDSSDFLHSGRGPSPPEFVASLFTMVDEDYFDEDEGARLYEQLQKIIKSDLDADRLDYLPRNAFYSDTSFGKVESELLIQSFRLKDSGSEDEEELRLVLTEEVVGAADHFLLSRWYDYYEVIFAPEVSALECLFILVLSELFSDGGKIIVEVDDMPSHRNLTLTRNGLRQAITNDESCDNNTWNYFNDDSIINKIVSSDPVDNVTADFVYLLSKLQELSPDKINFSTKDTIHNIKSILSDYLVILDARSLTREDVIRLSQYFGSRGGEVQGAWPQVDDFHQFLRDHGVDLNIPESDRWFIRRSSKRITSYSSHTYGVSFPVISTSDGDYSHITDFPYTACGKMRGDVFYKQCIFTIANPDNRFDFNNIKSHLTYWIDTILDK
jgi:HD superfamily phosphohydrolase